jgi:hypothetical protein
VCFVLYSAEICLNCARIAPELYTAFSSLMAMGVLLLCLIRIETMDSHTQSLN